MEFRPWKDIFDERRAAADEFTKMLNLQIYGTQNMSVVKTYEKLLQSISDSVGEGDLEGLVQISEIAAHHEPEKEVLTFELYRRARSEGLSNEQVREKYRLTSKNQIQGYARWYRPKRGK